MSPRDYKTPGIKRADSCSNTVYIKAIPQLSWFTMIAVGRWQAGTGVTDELVRPVSQVIRNLGGCGALFARFRRNLPQLMFEPAGIVELVELLAESTFTWPITADSKVCAPRGSDHIRECRSAGRRCCAGSDAKGSEDCIWIP